MKITGRIENVRLAVYELLMEDLDFNEDQFIYSGRNDNEILNKGKDRHKPGSMDRHKPSALRRLDRHKIKEDRHNILSDLQSDTGMELCCAVCFQLKSSKNCVLSTNLPAEQTIKYVVDNEYTRSNDGKLHV